MPDNDSTKTIENFRSSVFGEVEDIAARIIEQAENEKIALKEKTNDELIVESYNVITRGTREIKSASARRVSKQSFDSYRAVLKRRENILSEFFSVIEKKLDDFSKSEAYVSFVAEKLKLADSERPISGTVVYVKPADAQNKALFEGFAIDIKPSAHIKLGGVNIFYPRDNVWVDLTLDKLLSEEKINFTNKRELSF